MFLDLMKAYDSIGTIIKNFYRETPSGGHLEIAPSGPIIILVFLPFNMSDQRITVCSVYSSK
jgi:hypothetical protein